MLIGAVAAFLWIYLVSVNSRGPDVNEKNVREWATYFQTNLTKIADDVTQVKEIIQLYKDANAKVELFDPEDVIDVMKLRLEKYMENRRQIAKHLKNQLESSRETFQKQPDEQSNNPNAGPALTRYFDAKNGTNFVYFGSKLGIVNQTDSLSYKRSAIFLNMEVDTTKSAVHIPTPIYPRNNTIINEIRWTNDLERIFTAILKSNASSAGWMFFCSKYGFMRFFPATRWLFDRPEDNPPLDLYDCRTTEWYIDGATNSKNVVILLDVSGSMLGQRFEIARRTIDVILDTLSENDFFNVIKFNDMTSYVYECFKDKLVQASLRNKQLVRRALKSLRDVKNIANYTEALPAAFKLLLTPNATSGCPGVSSDDHVSDGMPTMDNEQQCEERPLSMDNDTNKYGCNNAVMLITDGADDFYEEIFKVYNPQKKVRFFSFLMGEDATDFREVEWMACNNNGYFAHVANLADVQEKVQKYIDVMSRPLALQSDARAIWTGSYFDRLSTERVRVNKTIYTITGQSYTKGRRLVTSVAYPVVFNKTFYGVVATAAPISELQQRAPVYMLGASSYTFLVDNNGYVLFHPQLRPLYDNKPKPNFNSMDIMEVEIADGQNVSEVIREKHDLDFPYGDGDVCEVECQFNAYLDFVEGHPEGNYSRLTLKTPLNYSHELRNHLVDGFNSNNLTEKVRMTAIVVIDGTAMKRFYRQKNIYYYRGINNTLLSLGMAVKENSQYRIRPPFENKRLMQMINLNWLSGENWRLHPDWYYCRPNDSDAYKTKEKIFSETLRLLQRSDQLPKECERFDFLINHVLFDANVTSNITLSWSGRGTIAEKYGIVLVFMTTQTGLTRYEDLNKDSVNFEPPPPGINESMANSLKCNSPKPPYVHFIERHSRSVDEVFYKRAMQFSNDEYVFDVNISIRSRFRKFRFEFESKMPNIAISCVNNSVTNELQSVLVMGTRSVYLIGDNGAKAPIGVVGFDMRYESFYNVLNHSLSGICEPDKEYRCVVLDEHAHVVYSRHRPDIGKFFAFSDDKYKIPRLLMTRMASDHGIYEKTLYIDFQAVCSNVTTGESSGGRLRFINPLVTILKGILWFMKELSIYLRDYSFWAIITSIIMPIEAYIPPVVSWSQFQDFSDGFVCDNAHYFYLLNPAFEDVKPLLHKSSEMRCVKQCGVKAFAARIKKTNLVLVIYTHSPSPTKCTETCLSNFYVEFGPQLVYNASDKVWETKACRSIGRHRRAPSSCYPMEANDNATATCSRSAPAVGATWTMARLLLTAVICLFSSYCITRA